MLSDPTVGKMYDLNKKVMNKKENDVTLEQRFEDIEAILAKLENSETSLEEAFELYKKGLDQIRKANGMLDGIEKAMLVMNSNGELEEF